jgi:hypothetical protein
MSMFKWLEEWRKRREAAAAFEVAADRVSPRCACRHRWNEHTPTGTCWAKDCRCARYVKLPEVKP